MFWLTWRQFRVQAAITAGILAIVAAGLLITGIMLRHHYNASGLTACHAHHDCEELATSFVNQFNSGTFGHLSLVSSLGSAVLYLAPLLIGLFWGAPLLSREFETGTVRLAWSQSVTRTRWLAVKLGVVGLAAVVTAGLLSLLVTWWSGPLDQAEAYAGPNAEISTSRLDPSLFGVRDIVPIGYAAFAVVLGAVIGVLLRRTVPAMAVTLAVFGGLQIAWPNFIRARLISPVTFRAPLTGNFDQLSVRQPGYQMTVIGSWYKAGAWLLSNQTVTRSGQAFTGPAGSACRGPSLPDCTAWVLRQHLAQLVSYEPASRFWAFQWLETGIYVVLAAALAAFCAWWLGRRRLA